MFHQTWLHQTRTWLALFFLLASGLASGNIDIANPEKIYLAQLQQQAATLNLAQHPQWQRLLHIRNTYIGGPESEVDDPTFFISARGKQNAAAELAATLAAFFSAEPWGRKPEPAQCAFVARYEWLNSQLKFDPKRLPALPCAEFDRWFRGINPASLTLVFPSAYINNPSSMFGHTLLRVDPPGQDEDTRLLSYAINYGANTGDDNGVAFALKGLFGGYYGTVGIGPYYKKVKDYSDFESRDIWEYQLSLNQQEVRRLLAHVWELRGINFDYYFFDENCAYVILTLLDVARPRLGLSKTLNGWLIPTDTLRRITSIKNLVSNIVYRPAAGTKLKYLAESLSTGLQNTVLNIANGGINLSQLENSPLLPQQKADTLLLAHDFVRYEFLAHRRDKTDAAPLMRALLLARSNIPSVQVPARLPTPAVSPDQGHATGMFETGGLSEGGRRYLLLGLRPAYHDLLDDERGYVKGAQINFLNLSLRYSQDQQKLRVNSFTMLDIVSLSSRDNFFKPVSWRFKLAWQNRIFPGATALDRLTLRADGGGGLSFQLGDNTQLFGLASMGLDRDRRFRDNYNLGVGLEAGLLSKLGNRWKLMLRAQHMRYQIAQRHEYNTLEISQRYHLSPHHALSLDWRQQRAYGKRLNSALLAWRWYL